MNDTLRIQQGRQFGIAAGRAAFARPRATFRSKADDRHTLAPRIVLNIHCLSAHVLLVFCNDVSVGSQAADEFSSVSQAERKNTFCRQIRHIAESIFAFDFLNPILIDEESGEKAVSRSLSLVHPRQKESRQ